MFTDCLLCKIANQDTHPLRSPRYYENHVVIRTTRPASPGHILVVPKKHYKDACEDPFATSKLMSIAALEARVLKPCNIITSVGLEADPTQQVFHLHVHIVPRRASDGLQLPWSQMEVDEESGLLVCDRCGSLITGEGHYCSSMLGD